MYFHILVSQCYLLRDVIARRGTVVVREDRLRYAICAHEAMAESAKRESGRAEREQVPPKRHGLAAYMASTPVVPVLQQVRLHSDSNPANSSDFSAGESTSELLEIDTPPLVLLSSRVKSSGTLSICVNTGVVVVRYNYESTTLTKLLQLVASKMKGRHALSIAFLMHGNSSSLKICSQKVGGVIRK